MLGGVETPDDDNEYISLDEEHTERTTKRKHQRHHHRKGHTDITTTMAQPSKDRHHRHHRGRRQQSEDIPHHSHGERKHHHRHRHHSKKDKAELAFGPISVYSDSTPVKTGALKTKPKGYSKLRMGTVPRLVDLCICVLGEYLGCVESLEGIPIDLKERLLRQTMRNYTTTTANFAGGPSNADVPLLPQKALQQIENQEQKYEALLRLGQSGLSEDEFIKLIDVYREMRYNNNKSEARLTIKTDLEDEYQIFSEPRMDDTPSTEEEILNHVLYISRKEM
jgi:hypothetical protein